MRILLVEDAVGMRKIVASMLKNLGYDGVLTASDGMQALQVLQAQRIDVLLTNWNMPVMDGLQLVKQVRGSPRHAETPVLMFTSRAGKKDVVDALEAGVDGYLAKPIDIQEFKKTVAEYLS